MGRRLRGRRQANARNGVGFSGKPTGTQEALANSDPQTLYFALWTLGFEDAVAAVKPAAAACLVMPTWNAASSLPISLRQLDLPAARIELVRCLDDEDLRLAVLAAENLPESGPEDLFERLHRLLERIPTKTMELPALVWPWMTLRANRDDVADLLVDQLGDRPLATLAPYLKQMSWHGRSRMVDRIVEEKKFDDAAREMLFSLVGITDSWVREKILTALKKCSIAESDALRLEGFLTRKNGEPRRAVLTLLKKQKTPAVLSSADRLLHAKNPNQRLAGLELLRQMVESKRAVAECRQCAEQYRGQRPRLSEEEDLQTSVILDIERVVPKLDDALGLMGDLQRSPATLPKGA